MQKDRDAFFCEGVSPKIVRGTGRIFGAGKRGRKLMQKAQKIPGEFSPNGVAILEFGPGRVSSGQGQASAAVRARTAPRVTAVTSSSVS